MRKDVKIKEKDKGELLLKGLYIVSLISTIIVLIINHRYESFRCSLMNGTYSDYQVTFYHIFNRDNALRVAGSVYSICFCIAFVLIFVFLIKKDKKNMISSIILIMLLIIYSFISSFPLGSACV